MRSLGSWALGALVMISPAVASAGPAKDTGQLLRQADEQRKNGEHRAAADSYAEYYRSQDAGQRASETGAYIVDFAAKAYVRAFEGSGDRGDLLACRDVLRSFLDDVQQVHASGEAAFADDARAQLKEVEAQLAASEPSTDAAPVAEAAEETAANPATSEPVEPPPPDPGPTARSAGATDNPAAYRDPDRVGIGLVVAGSITVAAGIGILVAGSQYPSIARNRLRDAEANQGEGGEIRVDRDTYLDNAQRSGNVMMGVGGAVIAVGLVPTIWGATRLAKHRKQRASLSLAPGRDSWTVAIRGRF